MYFANFNAPDNLLIKDPEVIEFYYNTERPYVEYAENDKLNPLFLPTTLVDLEQIYQYSTNPEFHNYGKLYNHSFQTPNPTTQIKIHIELKNICKKAIPTDPKDWNLYIDETITKISLLKENDLVSSYFIDLMKIQLVPEAEFFKNAVALEYQAHLDNSMLIWRFSNKGHDSDLSSKELSFGDSPLAGYIKDGMHYSDITLGIDNYSACVFSYYILHKQGIEGVKTGKLTGALGEVPIGERLPTHYKTYLNNLSDHEIYTVKLSYAKANKLMQNKALVVPKSTISSEVCFQSGESFHPRLNPSATKDDLSKDVVVFYKGQKFLDYNTDISDLETDIIGNFSEEFVE